MWYCGEGIDEEDEFIDPNSNEIGAYFQTKTNIFDNDVLELILAARFDYNDILNTRWAKTIKEQRVNKLVTKEFLEHLSSGFIGVKESFKVSRGIQAIFMAMNDSRFNEYEIYIDGFFNIGNSDLINLYFGEYLLISKWINNGDIKFFPEHVESERSLYVNQATKAGINLHGVK